jgi:hypothetical protein
MTASPRDGHLRNEPFADALNDLAGACLPRRRPVRRSSGGGLLGMLAGLLTSSPPSTGPCFDKPKGLR